MRGTLAGQESPVPLLHRLPGVFQDDEFTQQLVSAFDEGFAPVIVTLDGLGGYVDPRLAPPDFLRWLAGWVGVELDDAWTVDQHRDVVAGAALVHRRRGTTAGIADALRLALDADVEVTDSGGCSWSATPDGQPRGDSAPSVHVVISHDDPDGVDDRRIDSVIDAVKPAHVAHTYEVRRRGPHARKA